VDAERTTSHFLTPDDERPRSDAARRDIAPANQKLMTPGNPKTNGGAFSSGVQWEAIKEGGAVFMAR
jgi:hypothetical protein